MKKHPVLFTVLLILLLFVFCVWPLVELVCSIFYSRPSNPWEYYSVRHSVQEHLNEKHPDYFISKIEYYSYRPGYVFQLSNDCDSFIIDHFLTTLYCHHDMCAP